MGWCRRSGLSTVPDVEDEQRAAFRRALGTTLQGVRRRLTSYRSQASIAEVLGVDSDTVGRWERGEREPKLRQLTAMARLYGVPVSEFLDPAPTAEEQLEERLAHLARSAVRQAIADEDEAAAQGRGGDAPPGGLPRTRSA